VTQATRTLFVQVNRVNVRRTPRIEPDNIVDSLVLGDPVEILVHRAEEAADGWIWRRLADSDEHWLAERHKSADKVLLDVEPPMIEASEAEMRYAGADGVKLRRDPFISPDNAFDMLGEGELLAVDPQIRRWGRMAGSGASWSIGLMRGPQNIILRSGYRLLIREAPPEAPAVDPAPSVDAPVIPEGSEGKVKGRVQTLGRQFLLDANRSGSLAQTCASFRFIPGRMCCPTRRQATSTISFRACRT
jgi:hypothetical protein